MHAAEVVPGHVAEQHVAAGLQVYPQIPRAAWLARYERARLRMLDSFLVDGKSVGPERQTRVPHSNDDQLMLLRAVVVDAQKDVAGLQLRGGRDREVPLGDGGERPTGR